MKKASTHLLAIVTATTALFSSLQAHSINETNSLRKQAKNVMHSASLDTIEKTNPWTSSPLRNNPDDFSFAIIGDITNGEREGILPRVVQSLNLLSPQFVMCVGDLIQGYTTDTAKINSQWAMFEQQVSKLQMPFFYVPGNHDLTNNTQTQIWNKKFGRTHYHFLYRGALFLTINSQSGNQHTIDSAQVEYIRATLNDHQDAKWTFVFLHTPFWDSPQKSLWPQIESMLSKRKCTVFGGHYHSYNEQVINSNKYINLATSGGSSYLRGPDFGEFDMLTIVTVKDSKPIIANIDAQSIYPTNLVTPLKRTLARSLFTSGTLSFASSTTLNGNFEKDTMTSLLYNSVDKKISLTYTIQNNSQLKISPQSESVTLLPGDSALLKLSVEALTKTFTNTLATPIKWTLVSTDEYSNPIKIDGTSQIAIVKPLSLHKNTSPIATDGILNEWPEKNRITIESPHYIKNAAAWRGSDDCSFDITLCYDPLNLHIAVNVKDDSIVADSGFAPWEQDGVEIRIDSRPFDIRSHNRGDGEMKDFWLIALSPSKRPQEKWVVNPVWAPLDTSINYVCIRNSNGYCAEVSIPLSLIQAKSGAHWNGARVNIAVDDKDSDGSSQLWWNPDWRSFDNIPGSGEFQIPVSKK